VLTIRRTIMLPVTVKGIMYRSIAEAWRTTSPDTLKLITVRLRLRNKWGVDDAFLTPTVLPAERRMSKNLRKGLPIR